MDTVGLLAQLGLMNPFNRKQETEADYLGLIFSSLSGYDIRETVKIWERMKEFNKGKSQPEFMSTHPSADNRIKKISEWTNEIILDYIDQSNKILVANTDTAFVIDGEPVTNQQHLNAGYANGNFTNQ